MRPSDNLKTYIGYFQNQLAKVHNCSEDASAFLFISGLHVTHLLYKHLVNYVNRWSEVMYQAQSYIQLEEAMKSSEELCQPVFQPQRQRSKTETATRRPLRRQPGSRALSRSGRPRTLSRVYSEPTGWM